MGRLGKNLWIGFLAIGFTGIGGPVLATGICERLQTRLSTLDRVGTSNAIENPGAFNSELHRRQDEFNRATAQARRDGCLGGSFFQKLRANSHCAATTAALNRMKVELDRMTSRGSGSLGDPFANNRERRELVHALAENRCDEGNRHNDRAARGRGFFASLFGGSRRQGRGGNRFGNDSRTYRTLCVRTCDGYYFPISFSTTRARFATDEQTCRAQCPGIPVSLYVHRNPGQESEAMVSLTGTPYTALPTAFLYRKKYNADCSCGRITAMPSHTVAGELPLPEATLQNDPWRFARGTSLSRPFAGLPPVPTSRLSGGEDPETLANRAGAFTPKPISPPKPAPSTAAIASLGADAKKSIRTVGPSYIYSQ